MEPNENRSNLLIWITVVIIIVIIGIWFYWNSTTPNQTIKNNAEVGGTISTTPTSVDSIATSTDQTESVKEFTVVGTSFSYSPAEIVVNKGDKVKIIFKDEDGFHDLVIEGLDVASKRINGGEEATLEFTADKTGSFEYYCSVGSHRAKGMHGTLTVR